MSEQPKNEQEAAAGKGKQEVVINPEDCNAALDFWRHFNIPVPAPLQSAFDAFAANPSFANQELVKLEVCRAIANSSHEAFKDDMFSKVVSECDGVSYDMIFDADFEDTVTEKE